MLRLILECHEQIGCLDEASSYHMLAGHPSEGLPAKRLLGFKIPRLAEQLDHCHPYDYGLPEAPESFYHGQKVLFMVRNFRDAIASMLKLRGSKSWLEDWAIPILLHKAASEPEFADRWRRELSLCAQGDSPIACGALYWAYKNEALLRYLQKQYPVLPISYEALVRSPRVEVTRICRFLGVPFEQALLNHHQLAHEELDENGLAIGGTDPTRRIDTTSIGQWRSWLSLDDERMASAIASPIAHQVAPWLTRSSLPPWQ
jgi:hypothetical protein